MLSKCIIDFLNKYKKYIIIICIVFAVIILWKYNKHQENAEGLTDGTIEGSTDDTKSNDSPKMSMGTSIGASFSYCCGVIICGCLLPFFIMYFITRSSAKSAIQSTPCRSMVMERTSAS